MDEFSPIDQFEDDIFPLSFTKDEIRTLPLAYLKKLSAISLWEIWNDLDERVKANTELQHRLPCLEHYNRPEDTNHIDGPPPPKHCCSLCKQKELILANAKH